MLSAFRRFYTVCDVVSCTDLEKSKVREINRSKPTKYFVKENKLSLLRRRLSDSHPSSTNGFSMLQSLVAPDTILAASVWIASNCFFDSDEQFPIQNHYF